MTLKEFTDVLKGLEETQEIGACIEELDNLLGAMKIPMDPQVYLKHVSTALTDCASRLKKCYVGLTGEDPWTDE